MVLLLKEQTIISVKRALVQSQLIFSEICPEIPTKLAVFYRLFFSKVYAEKFLWNQPIFLQICPWKSVKFDFFHSNQSEAL